MLLSSHRRTPSSTPKTIVCQCLTVYWPLLYSYNSYFWYCTHIFFNHTVHEIIWMVIHLTSFHKMNHLQLHATSSTSIIIVISRSRIPGQTCMTNIDIEYAYFPFQRFICLIKATSYYYLTKHIHISSLLVCRRGTPLCSRTPSCK